MTNSQKVTLVYNYDSEVVESAKVPSRNIIANSISTSSLPIAGTFPRRYVAYQITDAVLYAQGELRSRAVAEVLGNILMQ